MLIEFIEEFSTKLCDFPNCVLYKYNWYYGCSAAEYFWGDFLNEVVACQQ